MKKFLRFIIVMLVLVAVAVIVLSVVEPKDVTVTRSIVIKAPKDVVFDQIVKFKNWNNWSPWYRMDSGKMKMTYYGMDGTPGSGYTWEGDKTGAGDMRDSAVSGTDMLYNLTFTKPHGGGAWGHLKAEDTAGITKVTWSCVMHFGAPSNAMLVFMNMEKMLAPDFENGLKYMKEYVESHSVIVSGSVESDIKEVEFPGHVYEGIRKSVSMDEIQKFFMESYSVLGKELGPKVNGAAVGLYYSWDTVKKVTDMAAAFSVNDTSKLATGAKVMNVPASKAVLGVLKGSYGKMMETHRSIGKYIAEKGLQPGLVVEEYVVGKLQEPDSNKWVTNIYYLVK